MTKKLSSKLLSVILTIAICATTVFGCLITANAADVACYTWSEGSVDESLTTATIDLTFKAPDALTNGIVEALFNFSSDEWSLKSAKVTKGACVSGTFAAENYSVICDGEKVELATTPVDSNVDSESIGLSYVTIELTLSFINGTATQGAKYNVSISEVQIGNSYETYVDNTTVVGVINAGCDHVYSVAGLTAIEVNTLDGYYVYKDVPCMKCGDINPYQVVPATELKTTLYWDGTVSTVDDLTGSGIEADPYIIDTAADLAYVTSTAHTTETYYKVADGIDAIVLQSETYAASIMALTDYAQTKAYFEDATKITPTVWANGGTFQGTFDGNGVEIYGMYSTNTNGGLFSVVNVSENSSTIKNVAVKNSYTQGANSASALVGRASKAYTADYGVTEATAKGYVNFEKVVISGCYIHSTWNNNNTDRIGVMLAGADSFVNVSMNNCLVYGNHATCYLDSAKTVLTVGGLFGRLSVGHNGEKSSGLYQNGKYSNSIILDCVPYADDQDVTGQAANHAFRPQFFSNVYTNYTTEHTPSTSAWFSWSQYLETKNSDGTSRIIIIDKAEAMGEGAKTNLDLDWDSVWFVDPLGGYPKFGGSDTETLSTSVVYGRPESDASFVTEGTAVGSGTKEDPYIISNAGHLRYLAQNFDSDLVGKYFKVADDIDAFVLQNKSYIDTLGGLDKLKQMSADEVKNYFTNVTSDRQIWQNGTSSGHVPFQGHLDFNGATIYGLYNAGGGLFQKVGEGTTITNLTIKNSYVTSTGASGAIVAYLTASSNYTIDSAEAALASPAVTAAATVTFDKCVVADSYIETSSANTQNIGVMFGNVTGTNSGYIPAKITNTLVYGCKTVATQDTTLPTALFGHFCWGYNGKGSEAPNGTYSNILAIDCVPYGNQAKNNQSTYSSYYTNVYTNMPQTSYWACTNEPSWDGYEGKIIQIDASDAEGTNALSLGLDWNIWSYDGNGGYPTPVSDTISTTSQLNLNLLGANIDYNDDGTFNFNFYYEDKSGGLIDAPVLYVGRVDGDGFTALTGTALTAEQIEATEAFKNAGLQAGTLYYSIKTISAREINDTFLPTAVAANGASTVWGKSEQISPADYATTIINSDDSAITDADKLVAAALVNYGTASAEALSITTPGSAVETKIVYADGGINQTAPTKGSGTETDPYIIENASHLRYLAQKSTPDTTYGKYYKVDPTIDILVLQTESYINTVAGSLDAFLALDAEGVKTALSNSTNRTQFQSGNNGTTASAYDGFAGSIDFSGVTICGMYNETGGLFTNVNGGASFTNLTLSSNYITSGWYNGNLIGYLHSGSVTTSTTDDNGTADDTTDDIKTNYYRPLTISNIEIKNCYQTTSANGYASTGVLMGSGINAKNIPLYISNVITHDNISLGQTSSSDTTMVDCALFGQLPSSWSGEADGVTNASFNSIVTLDCVPYPTQTINNQCTRAKFFSSVYTTDVIEATPNTWDKDWSAFDITVLSSADLAIGGAAKTNMPNLDWTNVWYVNTNDYPTPITNGAKLELTGKTIYWDGTTDSTLADNGEAGTSDDPIIVDTAAELAYIVSADGNGGGEDPTTKVTVTAFADGSPKYFKVADGIKNIVLQPESKADGIVALDSAAAVKSHFESGSFTNWVVKGWEGSTFCGNFDGNGATVYGLYSVTTSNASLFSTVEGGATVKNISLKNSYLKATGADYQAAGIMAAGSATGYGYKREGVIWVSGCAVANCYMNNASTAFQRSGVIAANMQSDIIMIDNCIVYGNDATYGDGVKMSLVGQGNNDVETTAIKPAELDYYVENSGFFCNSVYDSIILDCDVMNTKDGRSWRKNATNCYLNVYTNAASGTVAFNDGTTWTYTEAMIKSISADDVIGANAQSTVDALNTANGSTVWYVGNAFGGYPGFAPASAMPDAIQADYETLTFNTYNDYGTSTEDFGLYTTSLSLKNNPYLSLSFAFGNLNGVNTKYERDKIKITITKADGTDFTMRDGTTQSSITTTPPAYVENEYISNVDGWTNKKNAGRYHMYKLDGISIYDLSEPITVTIVYGDTTIVNTVSVEGFGNELETAYKKAPCDYYSTRVEATKALLFYVQALDAKYNA